MFTKPLSIGLIIFLFVPFAHAWPTVSGLKTECTNVGTQYRCIYNFALRDAPVAEDQILLQDLCPSRTKRCFVALAHKHYYEYPGVPYVVAQDRARQISADDINKYVTIGNYLRAQSFPTSTEHYGINPAKTGECLGVVVGRESSFTGQHWDGTAVVIRPPICETIPPAPTVCDVLDPSLEIDVTAGPSESRRLSRNITVNCSDRATITARLVEPDVTMAGGAVRVIFDYPETNHDLSVGINHVPISGRLTTSNAAPDQYLGSTTLVITQQ